MKKITISEFTKEYDNVIKRVENGESYVIESQYGNVLLVPFKKTEEECDDIIKIYTNHNEGS